MIIARIVPTTSSVYKTLSTLSEKLDGIMKWKPLFWFGFWTLFVAGMGAYSGYHDRFIFWDFSRWFIGIIALIVITSISVIFLIKNGLLIYGQDENKKSKIIIHCLVGFVVFMIGWGGNLNIGVPHSIPYILTYLAIVFIYKIPISEQADTGEKLILSHNDRWKYSLISLILLIISTVIGFILDDPVISTASVVVIPFTIVSFLMKHGRHVYRARVYSILIVALFIVARQSWFLIPLLLLFYFLRFYHYFRYGIIFPTFAVDKKQ